jgi:hypothetical protein
MLSADPTLRERLSDILVARELYWEFGSELPRLLAAADMTVESFFELGKDQVVEIIEGLPTISVQLAIRSQVLKNASRAWSINDLRDSDHLGVAIPYCDVVVSDKASVNAVKSRGLEITLNTRVLSDLRSLHDYLSEIS